MEISPEKSEIIAFLGQHSVRCKIVVDKCLQVVKNFKYLCCEISYKNEKFIQRQLTKFSEILRILNNTFKPTLVRNFQE
jgi:hypothetical protein